MEVSCHRSGKKHLSCPPAFLYVLACLTAYTELHQFGTLSLSLSLSVVCLIVCVVCDISMCVCVFVLGDREETEEMGDTKNDRGNSLDVRGVYFCIYYSKATPD